MGGRGSFEARGAAAGETAGRVVLAVVVALVAMVATTESAGAESDTPSYEATAAGLSYGGHDYHTVPIDDGELSGVLFFAHTSEDPVAVLTDGTEIPVDVDDLRPFHVALVDGSGEGTGPFVALYIEQGLLEDGGHGVDCAGVTELLGGAPCDNFKAEILVPTVAGVDFEFTGFDGFENAGPVGAASEASEPALTVASDDAPTFYASASPLHFDGRDYFELPSDDAPPGAHGAFWFTWAAFDDDGPPVVTEDNTPLAGIPGPYGYAPIHVALLRDLDEGVAVTLYVDGSLLSDGPVGSFPASCAGIVAFIDNLGDEPPNLVCDNFKVGILVPAGDADATAAAADFGYTGLSGFEKAGTVTVVDGYAEPRLTAGPYVEPTPTDSDEPSTPDTTTPADPTTTTTPTTGTGAELPRTGGSPVLPLAGLGLVLAGAVAIAAGVTGRARPTR